jgi:hypothetical protein
MPDFTEMNKEQKTEIKDNLAESVQTQTDGNPSKKSSLVIVFYWIINLFYILLFLQSCLLVFTAPMIFAGGNSMDKQVAFYLILSFPVVLIGIMAGAGYFYRKGQIKPTFLILLLPPLLYLVSMLLGALLSH